MKVAPATPAEIVDLLNREVNAALASPKIKERLENLGSPVLMISPAEFRELSIGWRHCPGTTS